jgi:hypothetical protein
LQTPKAGITVSAEGDATVFHFVCHSHDDVGWNLSPDEYYEQRVNKIISSVIAALLENPLRRFSQAEVYYFERWWRA